MAGKLVPFKKGSAKGKKLAPKVFGDNPKDTKAQEAAQRKRGIKT